MHACVKLRVEYGDWQSWHLLTKYIRANVPRQNGFSVFKNSGGWSPHSKINDRTKLVLQLPPLIACIFLRSMERNLKQNMVTKSFIQIFAACWCLYETFNTQFLGLINSPIYQHLSDTPMSILWMNGGKIQGWAVLVNRRHFCYFKISVGFRRTEMRPVHPLMFRRVT